MKQDGKERLINTVDSFFRTPDRLTRTSFCDYMISHGINAMFRENKEDRVYGLTLIDNKSGAAFNGSDLGKAYSGQAIIKQLEVKPNLSAFEKEQAVILYRPVEKLDPQFQNFAFNYDSNDIGRELFGLMKPIKSVDEGINPKLKQTKKKKRGLSR